MESIRWVVSTALKIVFVISLTLFVAGSTLQYRNHDERLRAYTWAQEFDFLGWTLAALNVKLGQWSLGVSTFLTPVEREQTVLGYVELVQELQAGEGRYEELLSQPGGGLSNEEMNDLRKQLESLRSEETRLQPIVEGILQEQIAVVLSDVDISRIGVPVPPVSFRFTPLPFALIVSPREIIRQDANISLDPEIVLEDKIELETSVEEGLDVSALVVPVGGLGTYPTMVQESTSLPWIVEVVAHEWVHNYLSLHPLGVRYGESPELRTMNETTASLLGKAIGRAVLERYYPEHVPVEALPPEIAPPESPPEFDFRVEMRKTRLRADELLEAGEVEAAENYMEERRQVFWEHGYRIRRLNQAYFAFHGAYADQPGGAAGDDPVGAAVRELWQRISSPARFLRVMAAMNSYEDLQATLKSLPANTG
jgi:hypothetical protein